MKTLFPPYAHPSPGLALDNETWMIRDVPGERRTLHQSLGQVDLDWGGRSLADVLADVEAWREDGDDYATAALRYESIDVMTDRASGAVLVARARLMPSPCSAPAPMRRR